MSPERAWPLAIVAVLALTLTANIVLLQQASGPGAASIEPDYYRRAVNWDSAMALSRADRALGWRVDSRLGPIAGHEATLEVMARDSAGVPLGGASVIVAARHNSTARITVRDTLVAGPGGIASGRLALGRRGLWELQLEIGHGGRTLRARHLRDTDSGRLPR